MPRTYLFILALLCVISTNPLTAQVVEIQGQLKNMITETDNTSDSVIVMKSDGMFAIREASTLNRSPWYLEQDTLGGIVFYIYKGADGQDHGLIVSHEETIGQWQSTSSVTGADRSWDGAYNMSVMVNSPAKDSITTIWGPEWYIPSRDELSILWHNRYHANKGLFAGGHALLDPTDYYWSSTEYTQYFSWFFNFDRGFAISTNKSNAYIIRPIRSF